MEEITLTPVEKAYLESIKGGFQGSKKKIACIMNWRAYIMLIISV